MAIKKYKSFGRVWQHHFMSTKRTVSAKAVSIPEGVQWLEFERSDGDPNTWPPKSRTERVVDGEGHVNFHRVIAPDEGSAVRWRVEVGAAVASRMGLPGGHFLFSVFSFMAELVERWKRSRTQLCLEVLAVWVSTI